MKKILYQMLIIFLIISCNDSEELSNIETKEINVFDRRETIKIDNKQENLYTDDSNEIDPRVKTKMSDVIYTVVTEDNEMEYFTSKESFLRGFPMYSIFDDQSPKTVEKQSNLEVDNYIDTVMTKKIDNKDVLMEENVVKNESLNSNRSTSIYSPCYVQFDEEFSVKDENFMVFKLYGDSPATERYCVGDMRNLTYSKRLQDDDTEYVFDRNQSVTKLAKSARIDNNSDREMSVRFMQFHNGSSRNVYVTVSPKSSRHLDFSDWDGPKGIYWIGSRVTWDYNVHTIEINFKRNTRHYQSVASWDNLNSNFTHSILGAEVFITKTSGNFIWTNSGGVTPFPVEEEIEYEIQSMNDDVMFGISYLGAAKALEWDKITHNIYISKHRGNKILLYQSGTLIKTSDLKYQVGDIVRLMIDRGNKKVKFYLRRDFNDYYIGELPLQLSYIVQNPMTFYGSFLIWNRGGSIGKVKENNIGSFCPFYLLYCY